MSELRTQNPAPLLTVSEAAAHLRISRWMLYRLIRDQELVTITIGARRLVSLSDLEAFIKHRRQEIKS